MGSGIRAEVSVDPDGDCVVVDAARQAGAPAHSVSRSRTPGSPDRITVEFVLETGGDPPDLETATPVFDYGSETVYRCTRTGEWGCPCEVLERFDSPPLDAHARDGALSLVFHAADMATLQEIMTTLQGSYPSVDVRRLLRSEHDRPDDSVVFVDRGRLTDRQREVLATAYRMGYFDHPKGANAGEVAEALGITTSTLAEHLAAGQSKLLDAVLER
jgi:DNA-binding CsgD family transcriptional regulator